MRYYISIKIINTLDTKLKSINITNHVSYLGNGRKMQGRFTCYCKAAWPLRVYDIDDSLSQRPQIMSKVRATTRDMNDMVELGSVS